MNWCTFCVSVALGLCSWEILNAEEKPEAAEKKKSDEVRRVEKHFEKVKVYLGDSKKPLKAIPAVFWRNDTRGGAPPGNSVTVLFVGDGLPRAACCVYPPAALQPKCCTRVRFVDGERTAYNESRRGQPMEPQSRWS